MLRLHEGQFIAGKYRLIQPLAKGGMGSVWTAKHVALNILVAVKFMDPRYADVDDLRARFEREATAAARLSIPNVVQILDYGLENDTPYIVMELLRGEDLGARLAREGRLSVHETVLILAQVCKALRRAHEEGIVHRDLKPANIFLVMQDEDVLVKVLDFGIAKVLRSDAAEDATKTGEAIGSPAYMSPEQVRGSKEIDHRTDLWSLGVIAYRALTGHLPFSGTSTGDLFVKICTDEPVNPTKLMPELGARIDAFMTRALAKDPSRRFSTAKEMAEVLVGLDQAGSPRTPFQSVSPGEMAEGGTNAPVVNRIAGSNRKKRRPILWVTFAAAVVFVVIVIVVQFTGKPAPSSNTLTSSMVSPNPAIGATSTPPIVSPDVASAKPITVMPSASPSVSAPNVNASAKTEVTRRKATPAPTPKATVNYSLRKEL